MSTSEAEEVPSNHAAQLLTAQAFREAIEAYCSRHGNDTDDVYSYAIGWTFGEGPMVSLVVGRGDEKPVVGSTKAPHTATPDLSLAPTVPVGWPR